MSLKERINGISQYFRGIEYQGGLLIVKVQLPNKITPYGSKDEIIKVTQSEDDGLWYYYADADLVDEDAIFTLIEETVKVYEEAKAKVVLMKQKIEELRDLFANNSLEKLNTLYFDFHGVCCQSDPKPRRKYTKRNKVQQNENKSGSEENDNNNEENVNL